MIRWVSYGLLALGLASAVFLSGGARSGQWQWSALSVSLAAILALFSREEKPLSSSTKWGLAFLGLLIAWMTLQWLPLPIWALKFLAPDRWAALAAARSATGLDKNAWSSLSTAQAATLDRLLIVLPSTAVFLVTRQMACWWKHRIWIVILPVVAVAFPESILGMLQFYWMRAMHGDSGPATGTYVYHNHFSGLLEMAFPLALLWAVWVWRHGSDRRREAGLGTALKTAGLLGIAGCLLGGITASLSRMGLVSLIAAMITTSLVILGVRPRRSQTARSRWLWAIPAFLVAVVLLLLCLPKEFVARFGQIATEPTLTIDARTNIWRDTLSEVAASPWTGVGLGAYEHGLYRFKTAAPTNAVDFAHNDYLQILAELGIPGAALAAALGLWILFSCSSVVLSVRRRLNWEFAAGLLIGLVTLGFHSLADFNLYSPANGLVLAWLGGVVVSPGLKEGR